MSRSEYGPQVHFYQQQYAPHPPFKVPAGSHTFSNGKDRVSKSSSFHPLFPHPLRMDYFPRGEPNSYISQAEVIVIPQHRLYVHLHHIYAVAHPPDSGNCVFHVIDVSHFCGSVCDIEIDGRLFRIRNLPNVDKLLIGVEVEPSHLINIAVAEPID
eukprot:gene1479-1567_t